MMGKALRLARALPSAGSRGCYGAAASLLHRLAVILGHAAKEGVALSHLGIREGGELILDEAKALEKAVGVHEEIL